MQMQTIYSRRQAKEDIALSDQPFQKYELGLLPQYTHERLLVQLQLARGLPW